MSGFDERLTVAVTLPEDADHATLVGRVWLSGDTPGPAIVTVRDGQLWDLTPLCRTMSELCEAADPVAAAEHAPQGNRSATPRVTPNVNGETR